jgi:hypothetical protein
VLVEKSDWETEKKQGDSGEEVHTRADRSSGSDARRPFVRCMAAISRFLGHNPVPEGEGGGLLAVPWLGTSRIRYKDPSSNQQERSLSQVTDYGHRLVSHKSFIHEY